MKLTDIKDFLDNIEYRTEIFEINAKTTLWFMHVPKGFNIKDWSLTDHKVKIIGRLKQFNRIKCISHWKKDTKCLVAFFTELLKKREWDFEKYPNPIALAAIFNK